MSDVNVEILQDLRDSIWINGPEHFEMSRWTNQVGIGVPAHLIPWETVDLNDCGTTCCAYGHLVLSHKELQGKDPWAVAEEVGLDPRFFFPTEWSKITIGDTNLRELVYFRFRVGIPSDQAYWEVALEYLDYLIKSA